jgi:hypothetical protein
MAEEIVIGKLIIDNSDLDRAMLESKKVVIELENEQKKLKKETANLTTANEEQLKTFVANEGALKKARVEYSANQKTVLELTRAQTGLDAALEQNIKTQEQATTNTKALIAARRLIDTTTVEGAKAITDINAKIGSNNKLINDSSSALEQQKINIGNYPGLMGAVSSSFSGATTQIVGFAQQGKAVIGELTGTISNFREAQEASKTASQTLATAQAAQNVATEAATVAETQRVAVGFQYAAGKASQTQVEAANTAATSANATATAAQATTQQAATAATAASTVATRALSIALLAIPIVALLAVIVPLISFLASTQEGLDKITSVTRPLVAIFESFIGVLQNAGKSLIDTFTNPKKALEDLTEFVKTNLINRFKAFAVILDGIVNLDFAKVGSGIAQAATGVENLGGKIAASAKETAKFLADAAAKGAALDVLEKKLETTRNANLLLLGEATEEVKAQNRIAEDQTKTNKEREIATGKSIVAAKEINRLKNLELDIEIAILENKQSRNDTSRAEEAELNKIIAKKNENNAALLELETTQTNKLNTIRKEAATKAATAAKAAADFANKEARNQIDILKAQALASNLNAEQRLANAQKVFDLENALATKTATGSDRTKIFLQNRQELSSQILAIAEDQINKELEAQKKAFAENKKLNQEQLDGLVQSATDLATAQVLLLDKRLLSERAYADEVLKINAGKNESIAIATAAFDEGEKARLAVNVENEKALAEVAFQIRLQDIVDKDATEQEIKTELLEANYARDLELLNAALAAQEVSEEVFRGRKMLAEKKFNSETIKNDKILAAQKRANNIGMVQDGLAAAQALFGESKALSVASALVNTYLGITAALAAPTLSQRIIGITLATATGFAAVKNILKTNKSSTSVDAGSGSAPVTTSGAGSFVNSAQTSTIATVSTAPVENNTVVTPPVLVLESLLEVQNQVAIKVKSE